MICNITTRCQVLFWAAMVFGVGATAYPVSGQEQEAGQLFRFGFSQKLASTENIRLNENSVGTTTFSDTTLSFGFDNQAGLHTFGFFSSIVGRIVDDPLVGTDSGFRDPRVDLAYGYDGANSTLDFFANYFNPDLAFNDPLSLPDLTEQDLSQGVGQREDFATGLQFETGLQNAIGFALDLSARRRSYSGTTDPLLFSNRTNSAAAGLIFRFSEVTQGRLDVLERRFRAEDVDGRNTDTRRFTFGLDHEISPIDTISLDLGHSKVVESFDNLPGVETNTSGPVAKLIYERETPRGEMEFSLDTFLTEEGRQDTLAFSQSTVLPRGSIEYSLGITRGDTFTPRPIGQLAYVAEMPRGIFSASLSRSAAISDILAEATETTRARIGYVHDLTALSALSLELNYADIREIGDDSGQNERQRGSFYASYIRDVTEDWEFVVGYEFIYFNPEDEASAQSSGIFFDLRRDFDILR